MAAAAVKNFFNKYPQLANCVTYGSMCVGAEFSQQFLNKRILTSKDRKEPLEPIDFASLGRYSVIGFCINPNILYIWYKWLDKRYVGTATTIIFKKVMLDQFLLTPNLYIIFYTTMSIMEGKSDIFEEFKTKFGPTFKTSCLFWLPVQTLNFLVIPNAARVVYVGTCSFIWLNILCWLKRKEVK